MRILFVEDNAFLREQIVELLAAEDREVVGCASAEEALSALAARPFDVLITDISLPRMSGMDLARHVLKDHPDAWVVISSGYLPKLRPEELGPHVRALLKPFDAADLHRVMDEVRSNRNLAQ